VHNRSMEYDLEMSQHENSMRFNATEFIDDELSQLMPCSKIDKWSFNENDWLDVSSEEVEDQVEESIKVSNYHNKQIKTVTTRKTSKNRLN
jgi:hypothetical protein